MSFLPFSDILCDRNIVITSVGFCGLRLTFVMSYDTIFMYDCIQVYKGVALCLKSHQSQISWNKNHIVINCKTSQNPIYIAIFTAMMKFPRFRLTTGVFPWACPKKSGSLTPPCGMDNSRVNHIQWNRSWKYLSCFHV